MTPLESMERHRDRLLADKPETEAGSQARAIALMELEQCIAALKKDLVETLRAKQRTAGAEPTV